MPGDRDNLDLSITLGDAAFQASGPPEVVMEAFGQFTELIETGPVAKGKPKAKVSETPQSDGGGAAATAPQESAASKVPLPQFLASDAIKGNAKVSTAVVAWAADHEGKPSLSAKDIKDYWKRTNVRVPANINRDVEKAQKEGWLTREGNLYSITGFGRTAIGLN